MKKKGHACRQAGFTIIEVLIFVTLISFIFISVSYIITNTLRNTKQNEYRIVATHYADELKEWLRGEKDVDWQALFIKSETYCFNTSPITTMGPNAPCAADSFIKDGYKIFSRQVVITPIVITPTDTPGNGNQQIKINIIVTWDQGANSVKSDTVFAVYE